MGHGWVRIGIDVPNLLEVKGVKHRTQTRARRGAALAALVCVLSAVGASQATPPPRAFLQAGGERQMGATVSYCWPSPDGPATCGDSFGPLYGSDYPRVRSNNLAQFQIDYGPLPTSAVLEVHSFRRKYRDQQGHTRPRRIATFQIDPKRLSWKVKTYPPGRYVLLLGTSWPDQDGDPRTAAWSFGLTILRPPATLPRTGVVIRSVPGFILLALTGILSILARRRLGQQSDHATGSPSS